MSDLRKKLIRLAWEHPKLRPGLTGLLRRPRVAQDFQFISNSARTGFEAELLPQIERWLTSSELVPAIAQHLRELLDKAIREKDSLYLLLIRYKSNDASAERYFDELKMAVGEWESRETGVAPEVPAVPPAEPTPSPAPAPVAPAPAPVPPVAVTPVAPAPAVVVQQAPAPAPAVVQMAVPTPVAVPAVPVTGSTTARED